MKKEKNEKKPTSAFSLVSKALIAILILAIVVQICIIVAIKIKHDNLEKENDKIPSISTIVQHNLADSTQTDLSFFSNFNLEQ